MGSSDASKPEGPEFKPCSDEVGVVMLPLVQVIILHSSSKYESDLDFDLSNII